MKTLLSVLAVAWSVAIFAGAPVEYEQFGAKGDGKTDDRAAIIAAHEAANRLGSSVRAKDGATYYVASDVGTALPQPLHIRRIHSRLRFQAGHRGRGSGAAGRYL